MIVNFVVNPTEAEEKEKRAKKILQRPLIVGASVSADFQTVSPGKRLALRYTKAECIKVMAQRGKPGKEVLKTLSAESFQDRTSIIGIDLFFWDSFNRSAHESLLALENLFEQVKSHRLPLVIGEVPELVPYYQQSVNEINQRMRELCNDLPDTRILPLNRILRDTLEKGYINHQGKKYHIEALLPDGLHLATPASEYLADEILKLIEL